MNRKALVMLMAMSLCLAVAAFAADPPAVDKPAEEKPQVKYGQNVGDNLQPVTLASLDGKQKVEVDKVSKKTIFVMMSSVCTACRKEVSEMSENIDRFKDKADIYAVLIDMDGKTAAERIGPLPFPILLDSDYKIGNATNLMSTPSTLIVQGGKILYSKSGYKVGQWKEYLK